MNSTKMYLSTLKIILVILDWVLMTHGNFNLFMSRREFQKLHGISSDIYYVREGVVNEYATSFLVTIPAEVEDLNFSWQALNKRPVYYEIEMEYTDFITLSKPETNITRAGRVPQNLETFRVTLPCSGNTNAEVPVTIRMSFQIKHPTKPNITNISIKRNKICLFKGKILEKQNKTDYLSKMKLKTNSLETTQKPVFEHIQNETPISTILNPSTKNSHQSGNSATNTSTSGIFTSDPITTNPSFILAGLLGGCAVTASAVFLTFFICLRRKLLSGTGIPSHGFIKPFPEGEDSSPACPNHTLLRSGHGLDKPNNLVSNNSYYGPVILGRKNNFWEDILTPNAPKHHLDKCNNTTQVQKYQTQITGSKGADVSPYAYAQILPPQLHPPPVPEWHSFSYQNSNCGDGSGHIYSNNLNIQSVNTFNSPKRFSSVQSSTLKSTTESVIQIDGFQCKRNLISNGANGTIERFL